MIKKEVTFYSDSIPLAGDLYIPDDHQAGQTRSVIIVLRGFWAVKETSVFEEVGDYGTRLLEEGYIIFQYDHPGFGKSGGERGRLVPLQQVQGVKDAITFLQQQPEINKEGIGLLGFSFGGGNVVYAAAVDPRVKCVAAINPVVDGEEFLRYERGALEWQKLLRRIDEDRVNRVLTGKSEFVDPYHDVMYVGTGEQINKIAQLRYKLAGVNKLSLQSAECIINYKPIDIVDKASAAILFIQAERDTLVPPHKTIETYRRAREPKMLKIIPGDHYDLFTPRPERDISTETMKKWFLTHLPPL